MHENHLSSDSLVLPGVAPEIPQIETLPPAEALETHEAFAQIVDDIDLAIPTEYKEELDQITMDKPKGSSDIVKHVSGGGGGGGGGDGDGEGDDEKKDSGLFTLSTSSPITSLRGSIF